MTYSYVVALKDFIGANSKVQYHKGTVYRMSNAFRNRFSVTECDGSLQSLNTRIDILIALNKIGTEIVELD
jgi:hypothetical protein